MTKADREARAEAKRFLDELIEKVTKKDEEAEREAEAFLQDLFRRTA